MERMDRHESLMELSGMGLLPGMVVAAGVVVFAMAALLTGSMWAVAGLLLLICVVTAGVVYVVVAVATEGADGERLRRRVPGLGE